jgi:F5/8 type C domain
VTVALTGTGAGATNTNLAAGKATSESGHNDVYPSSHVTDGNQDTYWESVNNAFPQWVQVDLGSAQSASRVVLQLPSTWGTRTQTLSVSGSTDGTTFTTLSASAARTFNPSSTNTVTITFPATTQRYFRVNVTANDTWPAGQISEFQVWNS